MNAITKFRYYCAKCGRSFITTHFPTPTACPWCAETTFGNEAILIEDKCYPKNKEALDAAKRPISPEEYTAYCDECGKAFNSKEAVKIPYFEYPGASVSYEEASPCCGAGYSDRPKEEDNIYECEHCNAEFKASEILYHKYGGEIGTIAFCPQCFQATKLICVTDLVEARK